MHDVDGEAGRRGGCGRTVAVRDGRVDIQHRVLAIVDRNFVGIPETGAQQVDGLEAPSREVGDPVRLPLFVDVVEPAALPWDRCTEENDGRETGDFFHQRVGAPWRHVLSDLEGHGEIEAFGDRDGTLKVGRHERDGLVAEVGLADPVALETNRTADAELPARGQPGSGTAADVDDGRWTDEVEHRGEKGEGRDEGAFSLAGLEVR